MDLPEIERLIGPNQVRLQWHSEREGAGHLLHWHLLVLREDGAKGASIDTGLSTSPHERGVSRVQGAVVKTAACLLMSMGWTVLLPSGYELEGEWFRQSTRAWPWAGGG
jgi:hypothetical protein